MDQDSAANRQAGQTPNTNPPDNSSQAPVYGQQAGSSQQPDQGNNTQTAGQSFYPQNQSQPQAGGSNHQNATRPPASQTQDNYPNDNSPQPGANPPADQLHGAGPANSQAPANNAPQNADGVAGPNGAEVINNSDVLFSWQASEYISHHRQPGWYAILIGSTVALIAFMVFVLGEILSGIVVGLMAVAVYVYAHKTPDVLRYELTSSGIRIGDKFYNYSEFRSFGIVQDTGWLTIELHPTQRFMPRITIFFDNDDLDTIAQILGRYLPRHERSPDIIDRVSRYLKF